MMGAVVLFTSAFCVCVRLSEAFDIHPCLLEQCIKLQNATWRRLWEPIKSSVSNGNWLIYLFNPNNSLIKPSCEEGIQIYTNVHEWAYCSGWQYFPLLRQR